MKLRSLLLLGLAPFLFTACQQKAAPAQPATGDFTVQTWVLPVEAGAMAPDMVRSPDGRLLLSWMLRREGRRNALQFASYTETDGWQSQPRTIAVGNSLVASAADTPHIRATADGALWAQWLQAMPEGAFGYDIVLARSKDGGMRWEQMTRVNNDGLPGEHGFVSLWPEGSNALGVAWLDGRSKDNAAMQGAHGTAHAMYPTGDMQLRVNHFDLNLSRGSDDVLDTRTCDCCQTSAATTEQGVVLAWRGRSAEEVRDIQVARFAQGRWSAAKPVHDDGWKVEHCPVSGPALAAAGNHVVLGWYSEAAGTPKLQLAVSENAGETFKTPVVLESDTAVLGRMAVGLDAGQAWAAWFRETADGQTLMLARYTPDLSKQLQKIEVAKLNARGMASGYPKLVAADGMAWLVWTDSVNGAPQIKGARITH